MPLVHATGGVLLRPSCKQQTADWPLRTAGQNCTHDDAKWFLADTAQGSPDSSHDCCSAFPSRLFRLRMCWPVKRCPETSATTSVMNARLRGCTPCRAALEPNAVASRWPVSPPRLRPCRAHGDLEPVSKRPGMSSETAGSRGISASIHAFTGCRPTSSSTPGSIMP